jgi:bacteriocin biosynthesis cyclodehydratase domain-containing protein
LPGDARLRLKRHYSIVVHGPDVIELRHGTWNPLSFTLADERQSGKLLGVVRRLDGRSSIGEIAAAERVPASEVEELVDQLATLGVLEGESGHALDYYLDQVVPNLMPFERDRRRPRTSAVLLGDAGPVGEIARILTASGAHDYEVERADDGMRTRLACAALSWQSDGLAAEVEAEAFAGWRDRFVVFASSAINPLELRGFNLVSLHHGIPWLHAAVDGPFLLVGPTFVPERTACYECLDARVLMNLREAASYQAYKRALADGRAARSSAPLDAVLESMLAGLTAFEALNFLLTGASFTTAKLLAVYLPTMEFTFNEVLRLPGCPACGPSPEADDSELYFDLRTLLDGKAADAAVGPSASDASHASDR